MRRKKVLLIEPPYRSVHLPFGLQKIAGYHLDRGDEVRFIHKKITPLISKDFYPDKIYITSVFTYFAKEVISTIRACQLYFSSADIQVGGIFASLMPEYVKKKTGIEPFLGIWEEMEWQIPNYTLFPKTNNIIVFTTRGCLRRCKFCMVKTLEPEYYEVENWREHIKAGMKQGLKHLVCQDNNFTNASFGHQEKVIDFCAENKLVVDFNQALDARLFTEDLAKLMTRLPKMDIIRFAFDQMSADGYLQNAVKLAKKYKLAKRIMTYVLFNYNETLEELHYRIIETLKSGSGVYLMKYSSLDQINRDYIGKYWSKELFAKFFSHMTKISSKTVWAYNPGKPEKYLRDFGKTPKEFIEIISARKNTNNFFIQYRDSQYAKNTSLGFSDDVDFNASKNVTSTYKNHILKNKIGNHSGIKKYR